MERNKHDGLKHVSMYSNPKFQQLLSKRRLKAKLKHRVLSALLVGLLAVILLALYVTGVQTDDHP